eukprot:6905774-Pyramimonas_sp.AAC.1
MPGPGPGHINDFFPFHPPFGTRNLDPFRVSRASLLRPETAVVAMQERLERPNGADNAPRLRQDGPGGPRRQFPRSL